VAGSHGEVDAVIRSTFAEVYAQMTDGATMPELGTGTVLLDTGMDSLGFAILVTRLEEELGYDPFSLADEAFYPTTYGEFRDFYCEHLP
jgi:acyl carrier protein